VAGSQLVQLDVKTGEPVQEPINLGTLAAREPQFADVDGDRRPDLVLVEDAGPEPLQGNQRPGEVLLHVRSLVSGKPLFSPRRQVADYEKHSGDFHPLPQWPLVIDLNDDGRAEIISPHETSTLFGADADPNSRAWGGLEALDGQSGKQRWQCRLQTVDQQIDQLIPGPDINGDGWRDLLILARRSSTKKLSAGCSGGTLGLTAGHN
jgi:hypothetical protein